LADAKTNMYRVIWVRKLHLRMTFVPSLPLLVHPGVRGIGEFTNDMQFPNWTRTSSAGDRTFKLRDAWFLGSRKSKDVKLNASYRTRGGRCLTSPWSTSWHDDKNCESSVFVCWDLSSWDSAVIIGKEQSPKKSIFPVGSILWESPLGWLLKFQARSLDITPAYFN
jgi:hypothetical protein